MLFRSLDDNRVEQDSQDRKKIQADIANPINAECSKSIQEIVVAAFNEELERSKQPGYKPINLDEDDFDASDIDSFGH